jgi:hypothetical protein
MSAGFVALKYVIAMKASLIPEVVRHVNLSPSGSCNSRKRPTSSLVGQRHTTCGDPN